MKCHFIFLHLKHDIVIEFLGGETYVVLTYVIGQVVPSCSNVSFMIFILYGNSCSLLRYSSVTHVCVCVCACACACVCV
jgi:hypothetical protein